MADIEAKIAQLGYSTLPQPEKVAQQPAIVATVHSETSCKKAHALIWFSRVLA